jgi:hypothetical protein
MVVVAVLDGELAAAFGVAIGAHSADETSTAGMEEEPGRAGGGGESGTDHLEAVDDGAGTRADAIAGLTEHGDVGGAGLIVARGAGGIAGDEDGAAPTTTGDVGDVLGHLTGGLDVFVNDEGAAVVVLADPEADEGAGEAEIHGKTEVGGEGRRVESFADVEVGVEAGEDGVAQGGAMTKHLGLPGFPADALLHGDGVVDLQEAATMGAGEAGAVFVEGTGGAVAVGGAGFEDFKQTPADDGSGGAFGGFDDAMHEAEGRVEGGDGFDGAGDGSGE